MSDTEQAALEFDTKAPPLIFRDWDGLQKWFGSERAQWAWLVRGDGATDLSGVSANVQDQLDVIANTLAALSSRGNPISSAAETLAKLGLGGPLHYSESPGGKLILDIRDRAGEPAAAFAYAFSKQMVDLRAAKAPEQLLGAILTALPDMIDPSALTSLLKQERERYRNSLRSAIDRVEKSEQARASEALALMGRAKAIAASALRIRQKRWILRAVSGQREQPTRSTASGLLRPPIANPWDCKRL